jgi:C-terminal processing protease CtpA/Prc
MGNMRIVGILLMLAVFVGFVSCNEDEVKPSAETLAINDFIYNNMKEMYLWNDFIPNNIDRNDEFDPKVYFDKLLYTSSDRWSFITDDYESLVNSLNGIEKSFGHQFKLFIVPGTSDDVMGIVKYVIPGTPASAAGIKRGDIFYKINGNVLTRSNYEQLLFELDSYSLTLGEFDQDGKLQVINDKSLAATIITENPIHLDSIIDFEGFKTGYIAYNQFISDYDDDLTAVMQEFKDASITNLVLDLRYNPGGSVQAAIYLASLIAPETQVNNQEIFSRLVWNAGVTDYLVKNEGDASGNFISRFVKPDVNLNLSKVYILVTKSTASASELIINCLNPYMEVVLIGPENTTGKYVGSITIQAEDTQWPNWAIQPIVLKTANVNWETDYSDGFAPDFEIDDDFNAPLGSLDEDMLARAMELITGVSLLDPARMVKYPVDFGMEIKPKKSSAKEYMYWDHLR